MDPYEKLDKSSPRKLKKRQAELAGKLETLKAEAGGKPLVGPVPFSMAVELEYIDRLLKRSALQRVFDANDRVVSNNAFKIGEIVMGDGVLDGKTYGPVINGAASLTAVFALAAASVPSLVIRRGAKIAGALTHRPVKDRWGR